MPDALFSLVDAQGGKFLCIRADESYRNEYAKHAAWWKRYARTKEYRDNVDPRHWPTFPVSMSVEPINPA
jgi:hypothetical protein